MTTDLNGSQNYYRGGPTNDTIAASSTGSSDTSGASSTSAIGTSMGSIAGRKDSDGSPNSIWGPIKTLYGPYGPETRDWDPGNPPTMDVLNNNELCGPYNQQFENTMQEINNANIPYRPLSTNSNSVTSTALGRAGLPAGQTPVWAPGWGTPLLP